MVAEKNNATCSICGSSYYKCLSCRDSIKLHPYKNYCCSVDCYKVFQIVRGYNTGVYNKDEFKSKLKNVNLNDLENYKESIKNLIKDALKEDEPVVKTTKTEVATEENLVVTKPTVSRKRNYKANNEVEETE